MEVLYLTCVYSGGSMMFWYINHQIIFFAKATFDLISFRSNLEGLDLTPSSPFLHIIPEASI